VLQPPAGVEVSAEVRLRVQQDEQTDRMQFYLDGYRPGDPLVHEPHPAVAGRPSELPSEVES
jgi:hypothetical protein